MAYRKEIGVVAKVDDSEVKQLGKSLNKVDDEAKKVSKSMDDVAGNGGAIAILDELTGGLATRLKDAFEASKLFNISLKGTRTALIATGIGAFVVALGAVVAYWGDIKDFITGANRELERQLGYLGELSEEQQHTLAILNASDAVLKEQGKSQSEINKLKQEEINKLIKIQEKELEIQKERLQSLEDIRKGGGKGLEAFFVTASTLITNFAKIVDETLAKIGINTNFEESIGTGSRSLIDSIFGSKEDISETEDRIKELELSLANLSNTAAQIRSEFTGEGKRDVVTSVIGERIFNLENGEFEDGLDRLRENAEQLASIDRDLADAKIANAQYAQDAITEAERQAVKTRAEIARIESEQKLMLTQDTLGKMAQLFGEATTAGKLASSALALVNTYLGVTQVLGNKTTLPEPFGTINKISSIALVLKTGFDAVKRINSVNPNGGGSGSLGNIGGGGAQSSPAFNIVRGSEGSQITDAINNQDNPVRAYVVSGEVTTGQELDRRAVEKSSI